MVSKQIRINAELYDKFLAWSFKGSKSFNEILEASLNYFLVTGIKPTDISASPFLDFKKDIDRIIKIVKAQEKQYFSQIGIISKYIETEKKEYLSSHLDEIKGTLMGDALTTEEVNNFLGELENTRKINARLNTLIEAQKREIESLKKQRPGGSSSLEKKIFRETLEMLENSGSFDTSNFVVSRHQFKRYKDKIIELTK